MVGKTKFAIGDLIRVQHWVGEVRDVATTEAGKVMLLVSSPKGVWRNHTAEWLEYSPEHIRHATREEATQDIEIYRRYIEKMLAALDTLDGEWARKQIDETVIAQEEDFKWTKAELG